MRNLAKAIAVADVVDVVAADDEVALPTRKLGPVPQND